MSERWQEIHTEEARRMRDELDGGGDSLDFEVRLCKRIAELEAEVERLRGALNWQREAHDSQQRVAIREMKKVERLREVLREIEMVWRNRMGPDYQPENQREERARNIARAALEGQGDE